MGGIKVLLVAVLVVAGIVTAISAIIFLAPYILALIGLLAIARMLVRHSDCKDETHSPSQTRPG